MFKFQTRIVLIFVSLLQMVILVCIIIAAIVLFQQIRFLDKKITKLAKINEVNNNTELYQQKYKKFNITKLTTSKLVQWGQPIEYELVSSTHAFYKLTSL